MQGDKAGELKEEEKQWIKRKVELPNFDGSDPARWLAQVEKLFKIHGVKPKLRVSMAFISMEELSVH